MTIQQRCVRPAASILLLAAFGITAVTACESGSNGGNATPDSGVCLLPEVPDGGLAPYDGFASGSATAPGVQARFCNARVEVMEYRYSAPAGTIQLGIDMTSFGSTSFVDLPAGGVSGTINVSMAVPNLAPGVYTSADSTACGKVSFSYGTPPSPPVDCNVEDDANPYACPTGCTRTSFCGSTVDASYGYRSCCVPLAKTFGYEASASAACQKGAQTPQRDLGSWTLTLTSVTPFSGDAGNQSSYASFYLVHGTLTASLQGYVDTTDTADLSLSF